MKIENSEENLSLLFENYFLPSPGTVADRTSSSRFSGLNKLSCLRLTQSFSQFPKFSVTHTNKMYESPEASLKVIKKNKHIYNNIISQLQIMQKSKLNDNYSAMMAKKTRLNFFRSKVKIISKDKQKKKSYDSCLLPPIEERRKEWYQKKKIDSWKESIFSPSLPDQWTMISLKGCRPEAREGATLTAIQVRVGTSIEERVYLLGGLSRALIPKMACLVPQTQVISLLRDAEPWMKRYGHCALEWEGKIVIVAGARMYSKETRRRECLGDVHIFNPEKEESKELHFDGVHFEPRRSFGACIIGNTLVVYGGLNGVNQYCSDLLSLNLEDSNDNKNSSSIHHRWMSVMTKGEKPGNLAFHSCTLVLHISRYRSLTTLSLNYIPENKSLRNKVEVEGIYIFGGRDERGPTNRLWVLRVGQKPCEWVQPHINGEPPKPRYAHTMNYYSKKNILILFGGRNDEYYGEPEGEYFNEIWVLSLEQLQWTLWDNSTVERTPQARYAHCSTSLSSSIMVFGGISEENYCRADFYSLGMERSSPAKKINPVTKKTKSKETK